MLISQGGPNETLQTHRSEWVAGARVHQTRLLPLPVPPGPAGGHPSLCLCRVRAHPLPCSLPEDTSPVGFRPRRIPLLSSPTLTSSVSFHYLVRGSVSTFSPIGVRVSVYEFGEGDTAQPMRVSYTCTFHEHSLISYRAPATPGGCGPLGDRITFKPVWFLPAQKHRLLGGSRGSGKASLRRAASAVGGCGLRDTVNCALLHHRVPRGPGTKEVSRQSHGSNT